MDKYIKYIVLGLTLVGMTAVNAQTKSGGSSVYSFLSLPYSSRLCALGGDNVAIQDGEISMAMQNPALLCGATDKVLELNYANYMRGTNLGSALFGWNFGRSKIEKPADMPDKPNYFAVGIHYLDYGKMDYADENGNLTSGSFTAKDILIDAMYARQLGPMFTVGVSLKPIMSFYESYSAFALAADVGGHFQLKDSTLQIGLTLRNIGWQLKSFYSQENGQGRESLPLNLELGLAYRFKHAPIRLSMTIHNMQRWNLNYELTNQPVDDGNHKIQWYDMMFRHTIFALDIIPKSEKFYLTLSYNHRRRAEMGLKDQRSLAGFGIGGGLRIKMVSVGFAVSQYTKGNLIYQASVAINVNSLVDKKKTYISTSLQEKQSEVIDTTEITTPSDTIRTVLDTSSIVQDTLVIDSVAPIFIDIQPENIVPEEEMGVQIETPEQTIDTLKEAWATIRGLYGNGEERKQKLGKNYTTIQNIVNELHQKGLVK